LCRHAAASVNHPAGIHHPTAGSASRRREATPDVVVYWWCMSRTNIDIDDEACQAVMDRYHLSSKRDAVNYALRLVASEALDLDAARAMRGSGWDADLEELRTSRTP
jgi:Arc/MetJ family transcription regulator